MLDDITKGLQYQTDKGTVLQLFPDPEDSELYFLTFITCDHQEPITMTVSDETLNALHFMHLDLKENRQ